MQFKKDKRRIGEYNKNMKYLSFLFFFTYSLSSFANNKAFLKCLGSEEKYFHTQKISGPYLKLNEKLISAFIQMSDTLTMKESFQKDVCNNKSTLPSIRTLEIILLHRKAAFVSKAPKGDLVNISLDKQGVETILEISIEAFVNLIDELQTNSKKPNCILENIPELNKFYFKARHIQEEVGMAKLIKEIKDVKAVFTKLNSKSLTSQCFDNSSTNEKN